MLVLLAAAIIPLAACDKTKDSTKDLDLEEQIEEAVKNMKLPRKINDNTTLVGCTYKDKVLTYRNEVSTQVLAGINADSLKDSTLRRLRSESMPAKLTKALIKTESSVRYIYVAGNDSIMFEYPCDELKK